VFSATSILIPKFFNEAATHALGSLMLDAAAVALCVEIGLQFCLLNG
jgi:hypothetical protein